MLARWIQHSRSAVAIVSRHRSTVVQSGQAAVLMAVGDVLAQTVVEGRRLGPFDPASLFHPRDKDHLSSQSLSRQQQQEEGNDLDDEQHSSACVQPARVARFAVLGGLLVGPALCMWYRTLERLVGGATMVASGGAAGRQALLKMIADQLLFAPSFLVIFLSASSVLQGGWRMSQLRAALTDYGEVLVNNWRVWPAVQLLNFYVVPLRQRVLFVQTVAVFWNTYLAHVTAGRQQLDD